MKLEFSKDLQLLKMNNSDHQPTGRKMDYKKSNFASQVELKAARKIKARKHKGSGVWFGIGMMGLIGWSIAIPTLVGAGAGVWLDKNYPRSQSWTLALLLLGLCLGCFNAWRWIAKEERAMRQEFESDDDTHE